MKKKAIKAFSYENVLLEREYANIEVEQCVMPILLGHDGKDVGYAKIYKSRKNGLCADIFSDVDLKGLYPSIGFKVDKVTVIEGVPVFSGVGSLKQIAFCGNPNVDPEIKPL